MALPLPPFRATAQMSTACSWVNIGGPIRTTLLCQVGHFYVGAVGQLYIDSIDSPLAQIGNASIGSPSASSTAQAA